jgi:hypothetical protein
LICSRTTALPLSTLSPPPPSPRAFSPLLSPFFPNPTGSHSILCLLEAGYKVVAVDNYFNSQPGVIATVREMAGPALSARFAFVEMDLNDAAALESLFAAHRIGTVM